MEKIQILDLSDRLKSKLKGYHITRWYFNYLLDFAIREVSSGKSAMESIENCRDIAEKSGRLN